MGNTQTRTYNRAECVVFLKTKEAFGGLSNMAGGFPVCVNNIHMLTSEALYQVCRFPNLPDVQKLIIEQKSPMTAKMKSKPYRTQTRPDWDHVRAKIMRWCLRVKLAQNWHIFSALLLETGERPIVEESRKDDYWGAIPVDSQRLVGMNVLGRFLMELREAVKVESRQSLLNVEPLSITDFLLFGKPIESVIGKDAVSLVAIAPSASAKFQIKAKVQNAEPPSLYDGLEAMKLPVHSNRDVVVTEDKDRQSIIETPYIAESSHGMIEGLKPYAEYKESGLPWASRVPAHWSLIPNRAVLRKRKVLVGENHKNYQLLSLTKGGVIVRDISTGKGKFSSDMGTSQEVRKGDFVFCLFDVPETPRTVGLSMHDGMITGAYTVFESRKLPMEGVRYLERFYLAMDDQKLLSPLYSGLRHTIPPPRFLGTKTPQPPADEQAAIVRFLDHANRKIDGFIRAKRKLIGLLNEQKQAIIHRAVTRGLHPDVPLKPSGIPWLGDIPMHWEVLRLGRVIKLITGFPFPSDGFTQKESDMRLLRGINVTPNGLRWDSTVRWERTQSDGLDEFLLQVGDIVLGMDRPIIAAGVRAASVQPQDIPALLLQRVARLRPKQRITGPFLLLLLQGRLFEKYIAPIFTGISVPHLSPEQIKGFKVMLPPVEEQEEIVAHITKETAALTTAIARTEREIALMQEYRTRLTADLVTGKLDVREAAAKLPVPPAEPVTESIADEPLEEIETEDADA